MRLVDLPAVVHVRDEVAGAVYIGRRTREFPKSILSNPFKIDENQDRYDVVRLYKNYVMEMNRSDFMDELIRIRHAPALACWCCRRGQDLVIETTLCHGHVLVAMLAIFNDRQLKFLNCGSRSSYVPTMEDVINVQRGTYDGPSYPNNIDVSLQRVAPK